MKKMAIFVALALSAFISNAQEVIELREARVDFNPVSQNISHQGNSFLVNVKENYAGEFTKDPVAFMHNHFNIKEVIANLGDEEYESYRVSFISKKGLLIANFDDKGNLKGTFLKFKNIVVPQPLQHQLYRDYKDWEMIKNLHIASVLNGSTIKDFYRITLKKGTQKVTVKINANDIGKTTLATLR